MLDKNHLRRAYGLTPVEYEMLFTKQQGLCAICGLQPQKLVVDHCHDSKQVRGLLCYRCNTRLYGLEHPEWYALAVAYLKAHRGRVNYLKRTRRTREQLQSVKRARHRQELYDDAPGAKLCPVCLQVKDKYQFYTAKDRVSGLERKCKACYGTN